MTKTYDVVIIGGNLEILLQNGTKFISQKEDSISFDELLSNNNISREKIVGEVRVEQRINLVEVLSGLASFGIPLL